MSVRNLRWRLCSFILIGYLGMQATPVYAEIKDKPVEDMEIITKPQRTTFEKGEAVDLYGTRIKVTFEDGEVLIVNSNDLTVEGYSANTEGIQNILVCYGDYSVPLSVKVEKGTVETLTVRLNHKGNWIAGTTLTTDMFKVIANTSSGSSTEVTDYSIEPSVLVEGRNKVILSYGGKIATVVLDAKDNSVQTIRVENPGKQEFDLNESFTSNGLKVVGHFLDGSEKDVTADCVVTGVNTSQPGEQYAKVEYRGKLVTYKVNVVQRILDHIDVTQWSNERKVYVHYVDMDNPIEIGAEHVHTTDNNRTGIRTFSIYVNGKVYTVEDTIPKDERVFKNSQIVKVSVPIGIQTAVDVTGTLGYIPETVLTNTDLAIEVEQLDVCEYLHGLPITVRDNILSLHLDRVKDSPDYYRWKVRLED